jgi:hypothetical protein
MEQLINNEENDISYVYSQLINDFNKMYPDKSINLNNNEMNTYVIQFCKVLRSEDKYINLLLKKDARLFKISKFSFFPKMRLEVILSTDTDNSSKECIESMWKNIFLLYLLGEANQIEPNRINMSKVAFSLDINSKNDSSSPQTPHLFDAFKNINLEEVEKMAGGFGINSEQLNSLKGCIDNDKIKDLMAEFGKPPTENSNKFVKDILGDIKTKFSLNEEDGKIDSKQFVEQLLNVGNTLGDSYGKKITSGELSINDIIGAISSLATNPDDAGISDLTQTLKLDKLDIKEILNELKGQLNGKLPPELLSTLNNFDMSNLENLNIGSLLNTMMTDKPQDIVELTDEQKKELLEYYKDISI